MLKLNILSLCSEIKGVFNMIGKKGNSPVISPAVFNQLESRYHFPFEVMKKDVVGYICTDMVWLLYREGEALVRTPFARSRSWFKAIISDPEFAALRQVSQIYVV